MAEDIHKRREKNDLLCMLTIAAMLSNRIAYYLSNAADNATSACNDAEATYQELEKRGWLNK